MFYTVTREVIQKNKVISHQNVFDDLSEAREFYNGTNGILSVCLYDENGTLMSFKGEKFEVKPIPEPIEEVNSDTVVETSIVPDVELVVESVVDPVENIENSEQKTDTETVSDLVTVDAEISVTEESKIDDQISVAAESKTDGYTETVAEPVPDTVMENSDQDIKLEFAEVVDAEVSDNETSVVDNQSDNSESEEYVQAEFNTVVTESNDKIQQLVLEDPIINKINTAPTYSFINKN